MSNTYAILKWPLVDPTYGSFSDYDYTSSWTYDHFFMNEGENQLFVYVVKYYPSGWNGGTSSSSTYDKYGGIWSYHRFGYLRVKHHLLNSYTMYLLTNPGFKTYTVSVPSTYVTNYKLTNALGSCSISSMDTQVKINGNDGWQFVSINAGNVLSSSHLADDAAEKII